MRQVKDLLLMNKLPQSNRTVTSLIHGEKISGLIWEDKDVVTENGQLLLYKDWATVHFTSGWYEIEAEPEINEEATQRDISIIQKILKDIFSPPATIIDIHCGSGRHAIDLAKRGFNVIGMEEIMMPLELAKQSAREQKVDVDFVLSNDENHEKYAGKATIVISMFNSLGYTFSQEDDQKQFDTIIRLLQPAGYFILDIRNHNFQKKEYAVAKTHQQTLSINNHEVATMYTTKFWQNNRVGAIERIVDGTNVLQYTTYGWNTYPHDVLTHMLQQAGAQVLQIHEDYYNDPRAMGERIIVLAQKKH